MRACEGGTGEGRGKGGRNKRGPRKGREGQERAAEREGGKVGCGNEEVR